MKPLKELVGKFGRARKEYEQLTANTAKIAGEIGVKLTQKNFQMQGYVSGGGYKVWAKRSPKTNAAYDRRRGVKSTVFNSGNPILKQTGNLYDGIHYKASKGLVYIGVDLQKVPYAKAHNVGNKKLPKRQWIGYGKRIAHNINKELGVKRQKIFTKL